MYLQFDYFFNVENEFCIQILENNLSILKRYICIKEWSYECLLNIRVNLFDNFILYFVLDYGGYGYYYSYYSGNGGYSF